MIGQPDTTGYPREVDDAELRQMLGTATLQMIEQLAACAVPTVTTGVTIDGVTFELRVRATSA